MTEGFYSRRARETGYQIEPHFFNPEVLNRYKDHPHYVVTDTRVSTSDGARDDVESSMIQQYVWGRTASGEPCVVVILAHLCSFSAKDQDYWRHHELPPKESASASIEERYERPMVYGEFPDTISAYDAIFLFVREIQKVFAPDVLLPNLDGRHPDFLAPIAFNTERALADFTQDLHTLLSVRLTTLENRITSNKRRDRAAEFVTCQQSRNLLRLYFEEHEVMSQEIDDGLDAFKNLNDWRVKSAHKLVPAEQDQDYRAVQTELVSIVQRGLRVMLTAMVVAEGADTDRYRDYVLGLDVD